MFRVVKCLEGESGYDKNARTAIKVVGIAGFRRRRATVYPSAVDFKNPLESSTDRTGQPHHQKQARPP